MSHRGINHWCFCSIFQIKNSCFYGKATEFLKDFLGQSRCFCGCARALKLFICVKSLPCQLQGFWFGILHFGHNGALFNFPERHSVANKYLSLLFRHENENEMQSCCWLTVGQSTTCKTRILYHRIWSHPSCSASGAAPGPRTCKCSARWRKCWAPAAHMWDQGEVQGSWFQPGSAQVLGQWNRWEHSFSVTHFNFWINKWNQRKTKDEWNAGKALRSVLGKQLNTVII